MNSKDAGGQSHFCYGIVENAKNYQCLLRDVFRLRYQVYVKEWKFENKFDHPEGIEADEYDEHAIHFFAKDFSEPGVVATSRIILNSQIGFPIEKHFDLDVKVCSKSRMRVGEISRLAVSKEYRKRAIDRGIFGTGSYDPRHIPRYADQGRDARRHCEHELIRGLYVSIYRESKKRGLVYWYAIMSKGLYIILKRWGVPFQQIGPAVNYHGMRAPYLASIPEVERSLKELNPELLEDAQQGKFR